MRIYRKSWLAKRLEVEILPATHVLKIRISAGRAEDAERLLQAHLTEYIPFRNRIGELNDETAFVTERLQLFR